MNSRGFVALTLVAGACASEPNLSTTSSEIIIVSPATTNFGLVTVGQTSTQMFIALNPGLGATSETVTAISENCNDFTLDVQGLPADVYRTCDNGQIPQVICQTLDFQNYVFGAVFHPTVAGTQSCVVNISSTDVPRMATLTGTGDPPPREIDVTPSGLAFGDVRLNTDSTASSITVRNLGSLALTISSITASGPYAFSGAPSFVLQGNEARTIDVTCHPTAVGSQPGALTIQSDDPDEGITNIALSCAGITSVLDIAPSPLVFAASRVNEPAERTIVLTNTGGASTTLLSVTLAGVGLELISAPPANMVLGPNGTANAVVRFPASAPGDYSGTLTVATSDGTRNLAISGSALVASLSLDPDGAVDFGPICAGNSAAKLFNALGTAAGFVNIQAISDPGQPFAMELPKFPARVEGQGANRVTFMATASPTTVGPVTSSFTLTTDVPNDTPRTIGLSVEGLAAGISATPAELEFGTFEVNATSTAQPVMLTNCTADPITFTGARIEGVDAGEFAIVISPTGSAIAATENAQWMIVASPRSLGVKSAEFVVEANGESRRVPLSSEGFDINGDGTGSGGDSSYYGWGCSAGGGGGWPVVALAILAIKRRKRAR